MSLESEPASEPKYEPASEPRYEPVSEPITGACLPGYCCRARMEHIKKSISPTVGNTVGTQGLWSRRCGGADAPSLEAARPPEVAYPRRVPWGVIHKPIFKYFSRKTGSFSVESCLNRPIASTPQSQVPLPSGDGTPANVSWTCT